jgi:hypothetical protein
MLDLVLQNCLRTLCIVQLEISIIRHVKLFGKFILKAIKMAYKKLGVEIEFKRKCPIKL